MGIKHDIIICMSTNMRIKYFPKMSLVITTVYTDQVLFKNCTYFSAFSTQNRHKQNEGIRIHHEQRQWKQTRRTRVDLFPRISQNVSANLTPFAPSFYRNPMNIMQRSILRTSWEFFPRWIGGRFFRLNCVALSWPIRRRKEIDLLWGDRFNYPVCFTSRRVTDLLVSHFTQRGRW